MITIKSYQHVNGVTFGSDEAAIIAEFGQPGNRCANHEGELELHYENYVVRFDASSNLFREFTLLPRCEANVNGFPLEWQPRFLTVIQEKDLDLVEVLGFVLSLKLGLAFSGFHDDDPSQMAIHAFKEGDWDIFRNRMKPFRIVI